MSVGLPLERVPVEHGVKLACYSGEPYYQPILQCTCGFQTERSDSWMDAWQAFDEHLKETA